MAVAQGRKILILTFGSRGDIQPVIALATRFQHSGFKVRVATNENHVDFVKGFDIEAVRTGFDSEEVVKGEMSREAMSSGSFLKFVKVLGEVAKNDFAQAFAQKIHAIRDFSPDLILTSPLEIFEVFLIAEYLQIPVCLISLQATFYPSQAQKTLMNEPSWLPHRILGYIAMAFFLRGERDSKSFEMINQLPECKPLLISSLQQLFAITNHPITPHLVGCSPHLVSAHLDWTEELTEAVKFTGFWTVSRDQQLREVEHDNSNFGGTSVMAALSQFLLKGSPVYMGWGSMAIRSDAQMACLAVRSLMQAGLRGVILGGWAELSAEKLKGQDDTVILEDYARDNILFVEAAAHEWLFPRCSVIVHHGGAGTTAAALRAGVPTIITPFFLDQFDSAAMVAREGVGIAMKQFSKVSPTDLANALTQCLSDRGMQERCQVLGRKLMEEDGPLNAVAVIDDFFVKELDTGKWKARFDERALQLKEMQAQPPPGILAWAARLLWSQEPNRFLPRIAKL